VVSPDRTVTEAEAAGVAARIAAAFALDPAVIAIAWAGSWTTGFAAARSDIDLYVYAENEMSLPLRTDIARRFAGPESEIELDNRFWEPGDEWRDAASGIWIDVMYRTPDWVEDQLARVLDRHEASTGYSTSFWHNVRTSRSLFDCEGWFASLQSSAARPYPEELRTAIIAKNQPILGAIHSSYRSQIVAAMARDDMVAVNHGVSAFLASAFDVIFALNRVPHPGEKRMVEQAEARCPLRPALLRDQVLAILEPVESTIISGLDALVADLDRLLYAEGVSI